jgi:hypothetical protein
MPDLYNIGAELEIGASDADLLALISGNDPTFVGSDADLIAAIGAELEIGAEKKRRIVKAVQAIQARRAAGPLQGRVVEPKGSSPLERLYLPCNSVGNVAAGAPATITVPPSCDLRVDNYVVAPAIANNFLITGIRIGMKPMLASQGAISAAVFRPDAVGSNNAVTGLIRAGVPVQIDVLNASGVPTPFFSHFTGLALVP